MSWIQHNIRGKKDAMNVISHARSIAASTQRITVNSSQIVTHNNTIAISPIQVLYTEDPKTSCEDDRCHFIH